MTANFLSRTLSIPRIFAGIFILSVSFGVRMDAAAIQNNQGSTSERPSIVTGRILVKFRPQVDNQRARALLAQGNAVEDGQIGPLGVRVLKVSTNAEVAVARAFANRPEVEFAEADQWVEPDRIPNDPDFPSQWHLTKIGGPTAWDTTTGSGSITIAILDTGVDGTHADLAAKMVPGWNAWDNNSDTRDVYGHGTSVAGAATAAGDNFTGVSSVSWNTRIMPMRISDTAGYSTYSVVANALIWAADHGARVANLSYSFTNSATVKSAAQYFQQKGGVVVMSSGNNATFDPTADNPYVLTVSATNAYDGITSWSNTGNNVDLSSPGESILTTANGGGYRWASGTSFSAPIVAGVAALVLSANPSLSASQVQNILKSSADDLGSSGWDATYGSGRVNAAAAVAQALGSSGGVGGDTTAPTITFSFPAASAILAGTVTAQVSASDASGIQSVTLNSPVSATDNSAPYEFPINTTTLSNGSHTLMATATDAAGNTASASIIVTVSNVADTVAPVPTISSPGNGATVSGNITINASATDNVGAVRMELWIDGSLRATSNTSNLSSRWNTKSASKGTHTIHVKAFDAANNMGETQISVVR
jgi:thermitase